MRPPTSRWESDAALWWMIATAAVARLVSLGLYPVMDQTEARYAEIARKMAETGDWVTPWFDHGVPFWGKPPLSFWMSAASFKVMGVSEFAARLPHWLGACAIAWLVWGWLAGRSRREAVIALALATGSVALFLAAGAVMTDIALGLGTTMAMRGFWLGLQGDPAGRLREQALFFAGLAIGLLAKGPIAAVLVGLPLAGWTLRFGKLGLVAREFRWVSGLLLTTMLVVPWYVLAELRTPGFLEYFLVGEHWHRFVTPGWQRRPVRQRPCLPRGSIWLFAIASFLPWSVLIPVASLRWRRTAAPAPAVDRPLQLYLLLWALTPCVFFSLAGNILWTYVLPGLPALAMLLALWLARVPQGAQVNRLLAGGVAVMVLGIGVAVWPSTSAAGAKSCPRVTWWPTTTCIARTGRHWSSCDTGPPLQRSTAGAGPSRSAAPTRCSRASPSGRCMSRSRTPIGTGCPTRSLPDCRASVIAGTMACFVRDRNRRRIAVRRMRSPDGRRWPTIVADTNLQGPYDGLHGRRGHCPAAGPKRSSPSEETGMTPNVRGMDRTLRIVAGLALLSLFFLLEGNARYWGLIRISPILTGTFRWCPTYRPFGISTCSTKKG